MFRKVLTFLRRAFFFGVPLVLVLLGVIVWNVAFLFEPIEPEEASPYGILLWICVRDLEKQSPETLERLLIRLDVTIGRSSGEMSDFNTMDIVTRKITTRELQRRRNDTAEYTMLAAMSGQADAAAKNDEILARKSLAERNILFLVKIWYLREMERHDATASESEKQAIMQNCFEDLKWWRQFSDNVYLESELPPYSLIEAAKEYEMTFEYYCKTTEPETYRRMLAFRDKLQVAFVVSEAKNRVNQFLGPLWKK